MTMKGIMLASHSTSSDGRLCGVGGGDDDCDDDDCDDDDCDDGDCERLETAADNDDEKQRCF